MDEYNYPDSKNRWLEKGYSLGDEILVNKSETENHPCRNRLKIFWEEDSENKCKINELEKDKFSEEKRINKFFWNARPRE